MVPSEDYAYAIETYAPSYSLSGSKPLPPSGIVLRMIFREPRSRENPVLWRLGMDFSQEDIDEIAGLTARVSSPFLDTVPVPLEEDCARERVQRERVEG